MSEDDYINATNLAKLSIVDRILRDVLPQGSVDEEVLKDLIISVENIQEALRREIAAD